MLLHLPQVLNPDQLRTLRADLDSADWVDGRRTVGPQGAAVKQNRQLAEGSPLARHWGPVILQALALHPLYFSAALPLRTVPPLFNRYEGGEHYGFHVDGSMRALPDGGMLRTDLSCTLFLAEPDEYEGGELMINDTYGQHEVKLPAGDLVLYPSSSLHCVAPVTRGARVASFFWLQSMVRDDGRRGMLFELDQTIQRLRAQLGDNADVVALTSHYHNLLRQWAEA
ncbi:Fe2+-dependent dioxygenase [Chitiniphilus eburneus]|uniref:Fe2+-dependent dioxygenase n=1 Tax=Chitiniphilus eburneus TaxID=2571148 RepID=A0A4U0QBI4_9NEIS|nr:Fe2+-dependent dioxygenase [Chitiniphilus eburneus]TJZ78719.1 Fe2+-dependent dioxygenase [Chitiniphilus eburneus]